MTRRTLALAALILVGTAYCAGPGGSADKAPLEGTWAIQALEVNGEKVNITDPKTEKVLDARLVIKGDQYLFYLGGKEQMEFTFKMNPVTKPPQIDLTVSGSGAQKGKTFRGIYKITADTYTICRNIEPGKDRPTDFATKAGSGLMIAVWKRVKA